MKLEEEREYEPTDKKHKQMVTKKVQRESNKLRVETCIVLMLHCHNNAICAPH